MPNSLSEDSPFRAGVLPETQVLLAGQDLLTGLSSRAGLDAHYRLAVARARRSGARFAVGVADLAIDPATSPDEVFGYDLVVVDAAKRLRAVLRETDLIARIGETRFAFLAEEATEAGMASIVGRVARAVARAGDGSHERVPGRVGIVLWETAEQTLPALLRTAEGALAAPAVDAALADAANAESFGVRAAEERAPPPGSMALRVARRVIGWVSLATLVALALAATPPEWRSQWLPLEGLAEQGWSIVRAYLPPAPDRP
jgi:GGDEF domain-containing protein